MAHTRKIIVHIATSADGFIARAVLDEGAIDEFVITIVRTFIGDGIPLLGRRHREVPLRLRSTRSFPDGVVQIHYVVRSG